MAFAMKPSAIFLLMTFVSGIFADETAHQKEIWKIEERLNTLTYRAVKLEQDIEERTEPLRLQRAEFLKYQIQTLGGSGCRPDYFRCGDDDPQCVKNLFVCDGQKDCRNGGDEKHCSSPFKVGDVFVTERNLSVTCRGWTEMETAEFVVKSVRKGNVYEQLTVKADLTLKTGSHVVFEGEAVFEFATRRYITYMETGDNSIFSCQFVGSNFDRCLLVVLAQSSNKLCAKFYYNRKQN